MSLLRTVCHWYKKVDKTPRLSSPKCWSPRLASESIIANNWLLSVRMSLCLSVTLLQIASSFFLFLDGIEPFFGRQFYKTLFFDFWFRPLTPKICTKSPISRLVWQIDRRCLGLPGGFRRWPIQWNHATYCGADPCCQGNRIWARRGDPVAYWLVLFFSDMYHFFDPPVHFVAFSVDDFGLIPWLKTDGISHVFTD